MSQHPSYPPKERVNIVYRSGTDAEAQDAELPLKMLVMGDYHQRPNATPVGERRPVRIDKDNFNAVMAQSDLRLNIEVPRTDITAQGSSAQPTLQLELQVQSLKDLTPEGICAQVEPLQKLLKLRQALVALKGPLGNVPAFRKGLQALLANPEVRAQLAQQIGLDPTDA
jgi:type VI secretion system protein ImpB